MGAAVKKGDDLKMWTEQVFELYLDADGSGAEYIELQVNPLGVIFDAYLPRPGQVQVDWSSGMKAKVVVRGTLNKRGDIDQGWQAEVAIPLAAVRGRSKAKLTLPPRVSQMWRRLFGGLALASDYPLIFAAVPLALYTLWVVRPLLRVAWALLGALPPVVLLLHYHHTAFGSVFYTGYDFLIARHDAALHEQGVPTARFPPAPRGRSRLRGRTAGGSDSATSVAPYSSAAPRAAAAPTVVESSQAPGSPRGRSGCCVGCVSSWGLAPQRCALVWVSSCWELSSAASGGKGSKGRNRLRFANTP